MAAPGAAMENRVADAACVCSPICFGAGFRSANRRHRGVPAAAPL